MVSVSERGAIKPLILFTHELLPGVRSDGAQAVESAMYAVKSKVIAQSYAPQALHLIRVMAGFVEKCGVGDQRREKIMRN